MAKYLGSFLAACGLLLLGGCDGKGDLKQYTSADGKYRVLLLGEPTESEQLVLDEQGRVITLKMAAVATEVGAAAVHYADMPNLAAETDRQIQQWLDQAAQRIAASGGGKLEKATPNTLAKKYSGREVMASDADPRKVLRARVYLVGTRYYSILVMGNAEWVNSRNATKILDSFQVTE